MEQYFVTPGWWHGVAPVNCGFESCEAGHTFGPFIRKNYLLHFILDGEGSFHKDGQTFQLQAGDIFVICPGEVTTYSASTDNPWRYAWMEFRAEGMLPFLQVPVIRQAPVRQIFEQVRELLQRRDPDGLLFALTYELLWKLSQSDPAPRPRQNSYAAYAKTYLETTYMRQISIQTIADELHIDRRYLTILFREAYGVPPQTYLMQLRLNQARDFLNQGYAVTEAAAMAGFSDLSNFSRQYKAAFGLNPSRQRK